MAPRLFLSLTIPPMRPFSRSIEAAVHTDRLPRDPPRLVADQQLDHVRDIFGLTKPSERIHSPEGVDELRRFPAQKQFGCDLPWRDAVDHDAFRTEFLGELTGQLLDRTFGCRIYA